MGGFKNGGGREREKKGIVSHDVPVVSVCWSNRATSSEFVTTHIFAFSSIVRHVFLLFLLLLWRLFLAFYQAPLLPGLFFTATCVICDDVTSTGQVADISVRYARGSHSLNEVIRIYSMISARVDASL